MRRRIHACHMRRRIQACHMRRRIHACVLHFGVESVELQDGLLENEPHQIYRQRLLRHAATWVSKETY